jgi:hypothetical protein
MPFQEYTLRPDSRDSLVYHGANNLTLLRFADSHIRATRDLVRDEAGAARDSYGKDANDRVGCRITEPVRFEAACVSSSSRRCATALEGQGSSYVEERQKNSSERFSHQSYGGHRCHRRASAFPTLQLNSMHQHVPRDCGSGGACQGVHRLVSLASMARILLQRMASIVNCNCAAASDDAVDVDVGPHAGMMTCAEEQADVTLRGRKR